MSFVVTVYVPEAIVMASDSRQTVILEGQAGTVNSDFAYKTFLLPSQQAGISTFGQAALGGPIVVPLLTPAGARWVQRKELDGEPPASHSGG